MFFQVYNFIEEILLRETSLKIEKQYGLFQVKALNLLQ